MSLRARVTDLVEIRGEAFIGDGLRGLGGGGIYQAINIDGNMLRTQGGWAQLNLFPISNCRR